MKRTISVIICGLVVLSSLLFATGCGKNAYDIDLSKYVQFDGFSGTATLNSKADYQKCKDERDEIAEKRSDISNKSDSKYKEYSEKIAELTETKNALNNITFSLVKGNDGKIKNGDTITVKAKYDEDKLKNFGVNIKSDEFSFKVSGLEEKKIIDPFDDEHFELKVSGLDGDGRVENGKSNAKIYYLFNPSYNLKNGDKVTVEATMYDNDAVLKDSEDKDGTTAKKEITISGLGTVPKTLDGVDTSDIDEILFNKVKNDTDIEEGDTLKGYDLNISENDYMFAKLKVTKLGDYKKVNGIYGYKEYNGESDCRYGVVYSRQITAKVIDTGYSKKIKKGSTKTFTVYLGAYVSGGYLMVTDDNKLAKATSYSMYVSTTSGSTYKQVKKNMTYDSEYKYTEVK